MLFNRLPLTAKSQVPNMSSDAQFIFVRKYRGIAHQSTVVTYGNLAA